jgi:hypothetical protein
MTILFILTFQLSYLNLTKCVANRTKIISIIISYPVCAMYYVVKFKILHVCLKVYLCNELVKPLITSHGLQTLKYLSIYLIKNCTETMRIFKKIIITRFRYVSL